MVFRMLLVAVIVGLSGALWASDTPETRETVGGVWRPLPSSQEEGLFAKRVELWRKSGPQSILLDKQHETSELTLKYNSSYGHAFH